MLRVPPSETDLASRQIEKITVSFFEHSKKIIDRSKRAENLETIVK